MKRVLATLLCATVIFSSGGFSTTAYAEENASALTAFTTDNGEAGDSLEGASAEASSITQSQDEDTTKETGAETSGDEASEATTDSSEGEAASEATSETSEAADEASTGASEDAATEEISEAADEASSELSEDAAALEDSLELGTGSSQLLSTTLPDSACFEVDSQGVLGLKAGTSLGTTAIIPSDAKVIPIGIFNGNEKCKYVKFHEDSQLTTIEAGAFAGSRVETVEIPAGVSEMKAYTFKDCSAIRSLDIQGNITAIGDSAFQNSSITSISLSKVTTVGPSAFSGCKSLTTVNFPILATIGNSAFFGCSALSSDMNFPNTITSVGNNAFTGCGFTSLDLHELPAGVTFGENCFQDNLKLGSVKLPTNLEVVPQGMFSGCSNLENVTIGTGTKEIKTNAFLNCAKINTIVFPNTYIFASKAFGGCKGLTYIIIRHNSGSEKVQFEEDSFPDKTGVIMRGYEVEVQDYADKKKYTFESLQTKYTVSYALDTKNSAAVKTSVTTAAPGESVKVTVTPAANFVVKNVQITRDLEAEVILLQTTNTYQVFEFKMPAANVTVDVAMAAKATAVQGDLTAILKPVNGYSPATDADKVTRVFDTSGRECDLVITDKNGETKSWLWNFTTSNPKAVTVTETGRVRSIGEGKATITATLKSNTSIKKTVPMSVTGTATIDHTALTLPTEEEIKSMRGKLTSERIDGVDVPVIEFEKYVTDSSAKYIKAELAAYPKDSTTSLTVNSTWVSTDSNIATVSTTICTTGKNQITIKKGAVGETLITASVYNPGQRTADDANVQSFIIRIVDATPRLVNSTLTLDSNSTVGTALNIVSVYGHDIAAQELEIYAKDSKKERVEVDDLAVYWDDDTSKFYVVSSHPNEGFAKTYSGTTQLFLSGRIEDTGRTFEIPITKLTVTNAALNPTLKTTGKINLFYNSTASADDAGKVVVTQPLKDLTVRKVELVSAANYKKAGSETPDTFAYNFKVTKVDNTTFEITRTSNKMKALNGKNVTAGYIYIYYDGYGTPVKKPLAVSVYDTAPSFALDVATATASVFKKDQTYNLQLVDKSKKDKPVVSLNKLDSSWSDLGYVGLGLTSDSTSGLFKDIDATTIAQAKGDNKIRLTVDGTPSKGKAVLYVKMTDWSRELFFTFTLNTNNTLPAVKFDNAAATLNKTYSSQAATITAMKTPTTAPTDGELDGFYADDNGQQIFYTATAKNVNDYVALASGMTVTGNQIDIELPTGYDVPKGTYNFNVRPLIKYNAGEDPMTGNALAFKVVVAETTPTITVGTMFKLNACDTVVPGQEVVSNAYKFGNLPTGVTGEIDDTAVQFLPAANTPPLSDIADITFADGKISASLKPGKINNIRLYSGKSLKYTVHNLKVKCNTDSAALKDFAITLQLVNKAPTVTVRATGTINPVDTASKVTLTPVIANAVSDVEEIYIYEENSAKKPYQKIGDDGKPYYYAPHFKLVRNGNIAYLQVEDGQKVDNNGKYTVVLQYKLASSSKVCAPIRISVVPKQTIPQIAVDTTSSTIYAGQAAADRIIKVKITNKNPGMNVTFDDPIIADSNTAAVKKAFKVESFNKNTGELVIKLVNPSALVLNSTYTVNLFTQYENQAPNTTGNAFSLKVTVNK